MLVLFHGFWGSPEDWQPFLTALRKGGWSGEAWVPDLFSEGPLSPRHGLLGVCQNLRMEVRARLREEEPLEILGYSMGGRLALHLALLFDLPWRRLGLVSTNPGLTLDGSAENRRRWEVEWSQRFLTSPEAEVQRLWDTQEVFGGAGAPAKRRSLTPRSRELLSLAFSQWSILEHRLRRQDFSPNLASKIDWYFGGQDHKYQRVREWIEQQQMPGRILVADKGGHRLLLDASGWLAQNWSKV